MNLENVFMKKKTMIFFEKPSVSNRFGGWNFI